MGTSLWMGFGRTLRGTLTRLFGPDMSRLMVTCLRRTVLQQQKMRMTKPKQDWIELL